MGTTVADFAKAQSNKFGLRDRHRFRITDSAISANYVTPGPPPNPQRYAAGFAERTVDFNNPGYYRIERARKRYKHIRSIDFGHSFANERASVSMPAVYDNIRTQIGATSWQNFTGVFRPSLNYTQAMLKLSQGQVPTVSSTVGTDQLYLFSLGSTAIARSLPDVPEFSLFRFIGELRAGLPKIPLAVLAKERKLRNVGGEYLNYQFGIMPTISDLQKLLDALQNPKLREAVRDQLGREFRVRKTLDKGQTFSTRPLTQTEMSTMSGYSSDVTGTLETKTNFKIWSSCSFAYFHLNEFDRLLDELDRNLGGGMGLVPTAIDIWNLVPWSWFVDWFTNFNHVITNLSYLGRDGLYLQRGYIMATYETWETHSQTRMFMNKRISTQGTIYSVRKYRVKASPFGFGLTWKDFDPFQLSILGALGVNRLKV